MPRRRRVSPTSTARATRRAAARVRRTRRSPPAPRRCRASAGRRRSGCRGSAPDRRRQRSPSRPSTPWRCAGRRRGWAAPAAAPTARHCWRSVMPTPRAASRTAGIDAADAGDGVPQHRQQAVERQRGYAGRNRWRARRRRAGRRACRPAPAAGTITASSASPGTVWITLASRARVPAAAAAVSPTRRAGRSTNAGEQGRRRELQVGGEQRRQLGKALHGSVSAPRRASARGTERRPLVIARVRGRRAVIDVEMASALRALAMTRVRSRSRSSRASRRARRPDVVASPSDRRLGVGRRRPQLGGVPTCSSRRRAARRCDRRGRHRLDDVVGDVDRGEAQLALQLPKRFLQRLPRQRIERAERLVEQHQRRLGGQRRADPRPAAARRRQLPRQPLAGTPRASCTNASSSSTRVRIVASATPATPASPPRSPPPSGAGTAPTAGTRTRSAAAAGAPAPRRAAARRCASRRSSARPAD